MTENNEEKEKQSAGAQLSQFFTGIFSLGAVNYSQSIEDIKADVSFKGFNIWILIMLFCPF